MSDFRVPIYLQLCCNEAHLWAKGHPDYPRDYECQLTADGEECIWDLECRVRGGRGTLHPSVRFTTWPRKVAFEVNADSEPETDPD